MNIKNKKARDALQKAFPGPTTIYHNNKGDVLFAAPYIPPIFSNIVKFPWFPIRLRHLAVNEAKQYPNERRLLGRGVPWKLIEQHCDCIEKRYKMTLEELVRDGGLNPCELRAIFFGKEVNCSHQERIDSLKIYDEANRWLADLIDQYEKEQ